MTQHKSENFIRLLLLLGSILLALIMAELGMRFYFARVAQTENNPTSGGYFSRYLIDENPAAAIDYYTKDAVLPFVLKPDYQHVLVDLAFHPVPFKVTLDKFGYRNQESVKGKYDLVVVGDSVAFGYGVNDGQTIAALLGKLATTYSLAMPNAGPEMYMVMIERFLRRAEARQIAVLFYEGNDSQNLADAYWKELESCSPPGASRILRKDTPLLPDEEEVKRGSSLGRLVTDVSSRYLNGQVSGPCELLGAYNQTSSAAIADLENFENTKTKLKENLPRALSYLQQLAVAPCVDEVAGANITKIIQEIRDNKTDRLASSMRNITASLAEKDCYPLGKGFPDEQAGRNLLVYANYYAGYYYDYVCSVKNGYAGNLNNFLALLEQMEARPELRSEYGRIARLKKILADRGDSKYAREISGALKTSLFKLATACTAPAGCDKEGVFLDYLQSLRSRKKEVTLFILPSENSLSYSRKESNSVCRNASQKGVKCVDLSPRLAAYYQSPGANGLYLDGAHLTAEGSARVAEWVAAELGLNSGDNNRH